MKHYLFLRLFLRLFLIGFCCTAVCRLNAASPYRVEEKVFSNVNAIKFDQSYGDITVLESYSKKIRLTIHYYDGEKERPVCVTSNSGNVLSIKTIRPKNVKNEVIKIDYILSVPRYVSMTVDLKYGNMRMDDFYGNFEAKLIYSNLNVKAFVRIKPSISIKYGDLKIGEADALILSTEYANVNINTVKTVEIDSEYTDYKINQAQLITKGSSSAYGNFKLGSVQSIGMKLAYSDLIIDNLEKDLDVKCAYSDVKINRTSKQLEHINLKGSYSDLIIGLHPDLSTDFDINLTYGDLSISKNYDVQYSVSEKKNQKEIKKGTIGAKSPTAHIAVSNVYGDVKIK
jgi:hypothetical protein